MRYFAGAVVALSALLTLAGSIALFIRPREKQRRLVCLPKLFLAIGVLGTALFLIPAVILLVRGDDMLSMWAFLTFSMLDTSLTTAWFNCRIWYDAEGFTAKNFWGIRRTYTYKDIRAIQEESDAKLYMIKGVVRIDHYAGGREDFLSFAKAQYKKNHNGHAAPRTLPGKNSSQRSRLRNTDELIVLYVLLLLFFVFYFALISQDRAEISNKTAEGLEKRTISVERYESVDGYVRLYEAGTAGYYRISKAEYLLPDMEAFYGACRNSGHFYVLVEASEGNNGAFFEIWELTGENGEKYYSFEDRHELDYKSIDGLYVFFGLMAFVALVVFPGLLIYAGRHPEKFGQKFIKNVIGERYIRS